MWNLRKCMTLHLVWVIFTLMVAQGLCKTSESLYCQEEVRLYTELFNNSYDARQRPGNCSGEPVDVEISLSLQDIITLDETNEIFTASSWIQLSWVDERLVWNSDDHSGLEFITINAESIWTPMLILENTAIDSFEELVSESVSKATVTSEGNVFLEFPLLHVTVCKIVITYFPFDIQNCLVQFSAQRVSNIHIVLRAGDITGDIGLIFKQWSLESLSGRSYSLVDAGKKKPRMSFSVVEFELEIHRFSAYHMATTAGPVFILSFLGISIFLIPPETGERLSVGVSVLLGLTFFELLVCDALPSSTTPPLLGMFWFGSFVIVAVSVLCSLISVNLYNRTDNIRGRFKRRLLLEIFPRLCCYSNTNTSTDSMPNNNPDANVVFENAAATNELPSNGNDDSAVESANAVSLRTFQQTSDVSKEDNQYDTGRAYSSASQVGYHEPEISADYKTATNALDRFFFVCIMLTYMLFTIIVLTLRP